MKMILGFFIVAGFTTVALAQRQVVQELPPFRVADAGGPLYFENGECLSEEERQETQAQLKAQVSLLQRRGVLSTTRGARPSFIWPVVQNPAYHTPAIWGISNFVDQDPNYPNALLDYAGGTRTYDTQSGNHHGTDIFLWPFAWEMFFRGQAIVVAAADGVIVGKDDGYFDQNCASNSGHWNVVFVRHADQSTAWYGHLQNGSLTNKEVGDAVVAGEYLGLVGSSGNSTGPHLHFEVHDADNNLNDPFAGPYNNMNETSWWADQINYYEPALSQLSTHFPAPNYTGQCVDDEYPNRKTFFEPGDEIYFGAAFRDLLGDLVSDYQVIQPDQTVFATWSYQSGVPYYLISLWLWHYQLPLDAQRGIWYFQASFEGQIVSIPFVVSCAPQFSLLISEWPQTNLLQLVPYAGCAYAW